MKDVKDLENKAITPAEDKKKAEDSEKEPKKSDEKKEKKVPALVRVQVKPRRAVTGIGKAGTIKSIDKDLARKLEAEGHITIL